MKITIGKEYIMKWPFNFVEYDLRDPFSPSDIDSFSCWRSGCIVHDEQYGEGHGERFYTAHGEGQIIYKVLSIAKMPKRFQDRIIFKRWVVTPDNEKYNNGEVRMLTKLSFIKDIKSRSPFRADYEVEEF